MLVTKTIIFRGLSGIVFNFFYYFVFFPFQWFYFIFFFFNKLLACQLAIIDRDIAAMNKKKKIKIPPSPRDHMGSKKKKIFRVIFIKSQTFLCYSFYDYYFSFRVEKEEKCYRCLFIAQKHPNVLQYKECMAIFLFRVVVVVFLCGDPPSHIGPMSRYRESHFLWLYLMRFELVLWCLVVSWIPSFDVSVWVTMKGKKKKMKPIRKTGNDGTLGAVSWISDQHLKPKSYTIYLFPCNRPSCP